MSGHPGFCWFSADWLIDRGAVYFERRPDLERLAAGAGGIAPSGEHWAPPEPDPDAVDEVTFAAIVAWQDEGLPLYIEASGVRIAPKVPLLFMHTGPPIVSSLAVVRRGERLYANGYIREELADQLRQFGHTSHRIEYRRAAIRELPFVGKYVTVTESLLVELSAVDVPGNPDENLHVGQPGEPAPWEPAPEPVEEVRFTDSPGNPGSGWIGPVPVRFSLRS